jgi:hypothetical protein
MAQACAKAWLRHLSAGSTIRRRSLVSDAYNELLAQGKEEGPKRNPPLGPTNRLCLLGLMKASLLDLLQGPAEQREIPGT